MQTKMQPCCARFAGKVTAAKTDLARIAQRAALADQKNQPMGRWRLRLANAKGVVENAEKFMTDHEADHASD